MTAVTSSTTVTSSEPIVEKIKTREAKSRAAGLNHALLEQMIFHLDQLPMNIVAMTANERSRLFMSSLTKKHCQSRFAGSARSRFAPASHIHFFHTKTFTSHGGCRQMDCKGRRHPMEIDPELNRKMRPFL